MQVLFVLLKRKCLQVRHATDRMERNSVRLGLRVMLCVVAVLAS